LDAAIILVLTSAVYGVATPPVQQRPATSYSYPGTLQTHAMQIAAVGAAEEDVCETNGTWYDIQNTAYSRGVRGFHSIPPGWNAVSLSCYGFGDGTNSGSPDNGTASYSIYVADWFGGAQLVHSGTVTIGTRQLSHNPATGTVTAPVVRLQRLPGTNDPNYCWIDKIDTTADPNWKGDVTLAGNKETNDIASINLTHSERT